MEADKMKIPKTTFTSSMKVPLKIGVRNTVHQERMGPRIKVFCEATEVLLAAL